MLEWEHVAEGRVIKRTSKCQRDVSLAIHPLLAQELARLPRNGRYVIPGIAALYKRKAANVSIKVRKLFELAGVQVVERVEGRKKAVSRRNFHCLRHTFVTTCARAGVPKTLISSWIGHSPVIDEIYQQWDQGERDKMIMAAQESRLSNLVPVRELGSAKPENAKASDTEVVSAKARLHQLVDAMSDEEVLSWLAEMNAR
jgi:integrase